MVRVFVGPNRFMLQQSLNRARADFIARHGDLAVENFDAEEVELPEIRSALNATSLFATEKLVVVKSLSSNKQAFGDVEKIIEAVPAETELLIAEPKPDKRSSYYKTLKKKAKVTEFSEPDENQMVQWLASEAKVKGVQISSNDARYLINRAGLNQGKLDTELRKLIDYSSQISRKNIDLLVEENPNNTVFDLLDAAFAGNLQRAYELYENLRVSGSQPQMILAMITWQMSQVALVMSAGDRSVDQIAADSGAKPFTLQKSRRIAESLSAIKARSILRDMQALDLKMKSQPINPDIALKSLISKITQQ